jgi:hypothetical protein
MPGSGGSSGKGGTAGTDATGGTSQTGGSSGTGGDAGMTSETGGTGGTSGAGGTGGKGGSSGKGGTAGTEAGSGGGPDEPECETHAECLDSYDDSETNPRACIDGGCVPLLTEDCPFLLPLLNDDGDWTILRGSNTIILGAYAPFNGVALGTMGRNYNLALRELQDKAGGVFAGSANRRKVAMVVCNSLYDGQDKLLEASQHLVDDLQVPAMVSALLLQDQRYVWENVVRGKNVFMMNATYSDQQLIDEPDDGLIWHMLSGADTLSVSYQPLLDMTVQHLRALGALGETENLKVVHIAAQDEPFLQDTANFITENLQINGQSVGSNLDAGLYHPIAVESDFVDPDGDSNEAAIAAVVANKPHVVIGTTVSELFERIIPAIESRWDEANAPQERPFYLVGALGYADSAMAPMIGADESMTAGQRPLYRRIIGINWPGALDTTVYDAYQVRYLERYGAMEHGWENFYDATYYTLYALAAARATLNGEKVAAGILRVTDHGTDVPEVTVGPSNAMVTYVNRLSSDTTLNIELIGAMGPPNWDLYGARNDPGSVWCVNTIGLYQPDKFRFNPTDSSLQPNGTPIEDVCFPFPAE